MTSAATTRKLVRMANQIGAFFASQPGDPAPAIAGHLRSYWTPAMRAAIVAHADGGGAGLDPSPLRAVKALRPDSGRAAARSGCVTARAPHCAQAPMDRLRLPGPPLG